MKFCNNLEKNRIIVWQKPKVTREMREEMYNHRALNIWFTGLPSSGKSTLAHEIEKELFLKGVKTYTLDGDNIRHGLCSDLGFSLQDRRENLRRVAEVIKLFLDAGIVVLSAFVSPLEQDRLLVKNIIGPDNFILIYCKCPVKICEKRDPKGLYKLAREGKIKSYTGISSPYEEPIAPDLTIDTSEVTIQEAVNRILEFISPKIFLG